MNRPRLYWMLSSPVTDAQNSQDWQDEWQSRGFSNAMGNERRILMLYYSIDALNWFQAGCVAMWPSLLQAFNYAAPLVSGDDLLIISRTAKNARNQHDADLVTLHRVKRFRSFALDLFPPILMALARESEGPGRVMRADRG